MYNKVAPIAKQIAPLIHKREEEELYARGMADVDKRGEDLDALE